MLRTARQHALVHVRILDEVVPAEAAVEAQHIYPKRLGGEALDHMAAAPYRPAQAPHEPIAERDEGVLVAQVDLEERLRGHAELRLLGVHRALERDASIEETGRLSMQGVELRRRLEVSENRAELHSVLNAKMVIEHEHWYVPTVKSSFAAYPEWTSAFF